MNKILQNIKSGHPTASSIAFVEGLMRSRSYAELGIYIVAYMKYAVQIDYDLLIETGMSCDDPYIVSEIIKCLRYRKYKTNQYGELIRYAMEWPHPDPVHDVLLASIHAVPTAIPLSDYIKNFIKHTMTAEDEVIRDMAVYLAQEYLDIPENRKVSTFGSGDLIEYADPEVRKWLEDL